MTKTTTIPHNAAYLNLTNPFIGYQDLFDNLEKLKPKSVQQTFPFYDLIKKSGEELQLIIVATGKTKDDVNISLDGNTLKIEARSTTYPEEYEILDRGIALRSFKKEFTLHEYIDIISAKVEHGLIVIDMKYIIPEHEKPKIINIE